MVLARLEAAESVGGVDEGSGGGMREMLIRGPFQISKIGQSLH